MVYVEVICMIFKVGLNDKLVVVRVVVVGCFCVVVMIGGFGVGFGGFEFCINFCLKVYIRLGYWFFLSILLIVVLFVFWNFV